ncbi:MAG: prephenate dehydrogenase/arogenate dehydrogenase family protein [Gemmatimonadetes bacterium]|nr:prephenate dehydrogenase/arogenate dehydrogenase family protein [Gemmatimonadota bacterium]
MRPEALGVIGLGAIGGSVAWGASVAGVRRVIGYSPLPAETVAAAKAGAVTEVAQSVRQVMKQSEMVVIAAPPAATLTLLATIAPDLLSRGVLCTDVSSVKSPVVTEAARLRLGELFAGSHPLAGTHQSGFDAARSDRFVGAVVYVTPTPTGAQGALEVADFWQGVLKATPVTIDAEVHDRMLAWTSHLPQVTASALAAALARTGPPGVTYGSGARDTTRLAASSVEMWRDILLLNRDAVLVTLDGLEDQIGVLRQALVARDEAAVAAWLEAGAAWRRGLGE